MKLSKRNWLIRWAYWMDGDTPTRTNVCAVFWRAFISTPIFSVLAAILCVILSPVILLIWLTEDFESIKHASARLSTRWETSMVRQRVSDFKNKTCTLIELE